MDDWEEARRKKTRDKRNVSIRRTEGRRGEEWRRKRYVSQTKDMEGGKDSSKKDVRARKEGGMKKKRE